MILKHLCQEHRIYFYLFKCTFVYFTEHMKLLRHACHIRSSLFIHTTATIVLCVKFYKVDHVFIGYDFVLSTIKDYIVFPPFFSSSHSLFCFVFNFIGVPSRYSSVAILKQGIIIVS